MWVPNCGEICSIRAPGVLFKLLLACLPLLSRLVEGCSPVEGPEPTLAESVHSAGAVWHGKILKTYPARSFGSSVYTAEMSIYCIVKGPVVGKIANISEAGFVPGHCHQSNLEVGKSYIVLLYRYTDDDENVQYKISHGEIEPTEDNLKKVFSPCSLNPQYPTGVSENTAEVRCHAPVTPCLAEKLSNPHPNGTAPEVGEPFDPDSVHSPDDGHDHSHDSDAESPTALPEGHSEDDGHDHKGHHEGDGHTHKGHYDGDGHEHHGHYDAEGNVNEGHKHEDHHEGDHDHFEGDGHDHDAHSKNGTSKEPVVAVSGKEDPKSGESHSGTVSNFQIHLIMSLLSFLTLSLIC